MPKDPRIKKVLVIGSGPIIIGQAAEFDYSGTQACRALKEEGLEVVLINSNPATIMTDKDIADRVYIEPLTVEVVEQLILKEKPDSILSGFGGQTGLTLSMQLAKEGFLKEHNVRLLGASPETIDKAEDRQMVKDTMESIGQPCIPSKVVTTVEDALEFAEDPFDTRRYRNLYGCHQCPEALQGRREGGRYQFRVRYQPDKLQRHQGGRYYRILRRNRSEANIIIE